MFFILFWIVKDLHNEFNLNPFYIKQTNKIQQNHVCHFLTHAITISIFFFNIILNFYINKKNLITARRNHHLKKSLKFNSYH